MVFQTNWLRVNDLTKLSFILETSSPESFISLPERELFRVRRWKAGKEVFIFHLASIQDHCYYHYTFPFWKRCLWSAAERRIEEMIFALVGQFRHANCLICEPEQFQMSSKPSTSSQTFLSLIIPFTGAHAPRNWPICIWMASTLVKNCPGITHFMVSNPTEATWNFSGAHMNSCLNFTSRTVSSIGTFLLLSVMLFRYLLGTVTISLQF